MHFDHVTAVVADADVAAAALTRLLGAAPVATLSLPGMAIRSFRVGDAEIHVNAPTGPGPVHDHHCKHGSGYHHLALRVDDLDATLVELSARGFAVLGAPIQTAPGLREVFLDPACTGGLMIQLVERREVALETYELDAEAVAALAARAPAEGR
jgi:catechol 2,3-dioxygenase-like lactoylglutathione lyase family enzyme